MKPGRGQDPSPEARLSRTLLGLLALVLISVVNTGYCYFCDNHALQLPLVEKLIEPALFPADPFVETLGDYVSLVWWPIAFLARAIDLEILLLAFFLLTRFLLVYSCYRLGTTLSPDSPMVGLVAATLAALAPQSIVGDGNLTETYFEQTSLFVPLFMLALANLLAGRAMRFVVLWALAFLTNPMYGVWSGIFFVGTWLADPERVSLRALLRSLPLFILLVAPILLKAVSMVSRPKPDRELWGWLIRLLNAPHLAPSTWPVIAFLQFGAFVALMLIAGWWIRRIDRRVGSLSLMWTTLALGFLLLGLVVGAGNRWLEILVLQPARATDLSYLSVAIAVLGGLVTWAVQRRTAGRAFVAMAVFVLTAYLLSPSFRGHALGPTLLMSAVVLVTTVRRGAVESSMRRGFKLVLLTALFVSMLGSFQARAARLNSARQALYRGPSETMVKIAEWARETSAKDAVFLHDPIGWRWAQFRYLADRSVYSTWKDASAVLWAPMFAEAWSERFAALGFAGRYRDHRDIGEPGEIHDIRRSLRRRYRNLEDDDVERIKSEFRIDYWIAPAKTVSRLPVVFATEDFKVFQIAKASP